MCTPAATGAGVLHSMRMLQHSALAFSNDAHMILVGLGRAGQVRQAVRQARQRPGRGSLRQEGCIRQSSLDNAEHMLHTCATCRTLFCCCKAISPLWPSR